MNIVILAAGQASRLGKQTKNIQKCLISFAGKPAIDYLLERLPQADRVLVCISDDFRGALLKGYLLEKHPELDLQFVVQPQPIGTANAVYLCLKDCFDDVIISWSDIFPKQRIDVPDNSTIFTTSDFACRYRFDDGRIEKTDGNIFGLFFVKTPQKLVELLEKNQDKDFVDVLQMSEEDFDNVPIECYDFGTQQTLKQTTDTLSTSAWASIIRDGSVIHKQYIEEAEGTFAKEANWYLFAPASVRRFVPKLHSVIDEERKIDMEYIDADPVDFDTEGEMKDFLARLVYVLDEHFHANEYPTHRESLLTEYVVAPIERCKATVNMVPRFGGNVVTINGNTYENPLYLLNDTWFVGRIIDKLTPQCFTFIHGDPTLQNIMQRAGNLWFIDPKAKFGNIWLYGDPKYDFAKLYYSFVGNYDQFNVGNYWLSTTEEFKYGIEKSKFNNLGDWYLGYLDRKLGIDPDSIKLIHALIWLRAVGYNLPRSIEQAIVALLNGTVLLNEAKERM